MARRDTDKKGFIVVNPTQDKQDILIVLETMKDPGKIIQKIRRFVGILENQSKGKIVLGTIGEKPVPRIADSEIDELISAVKATPDDIASVTTMLATIEVKSYVESGDRINVWNYADALIDSVLESRGLQQIADSVIYTIPDLVALFLKEE